MKDLFVKILAFMLGIKDRSSDELAEDGRRIRLGMLQDRLKQRISMEQVREIYMLGAMESTNDLNAVKLDLLTGQIPRFKFPDFNSSKDYINIYQIITFDDRYFIYALSDKTNFMKVDDLLMFVEVRKRIPTSHLPEEARYK